MTSLRLCVVASALGVAALEGAASARAAALIHYYPMNGSVADVVGGADGTLLNGADASAGYLALGTGAGYVQMNEHIVPTLGSYSVAFFARLNEFRGDYFEFISQGSSGGPGFYIGKNTANGFRLTDSWINPGIAMIAVGEWHHIALSCDATDNISTLYIDGSAAGSLGNSFPTTPAGSNTRLGRQFSPYDEFFPGDLDEVRVYSGALSADEVLALAVPSPAACAALSLGSLVLARRRRA